MSKANSVAEAGLHFACREPFAAADRSLATPQTSSRRLLLVEDDVASAKAMTVILQRRGFEVTVAATLGEARKALAHKPSFVILDLMLPDGDGQVLLETIRHQNPAAWVGVTTGVDDPERLKKLNQLKPSLLMRKPINIAELLKALQVT